MNADQVLAGGGVAGLVIAVSYIGRLVLDWFKEKRSGDVVEKSTSVTDAATANAVILQSLKALGEENVRLQKKVGHLESESAAKDRKISELNDRLGTAQEQIQSIADELAQLKTNR
ncbi:MAG: hypothetical protein JWM40_674 [Frankiales bacterium]|nr:hypothetical protein [Frankiales bacterium]